ncbi:SPOR domain-containing protein [Polaribacter sp. SA4-12]|uniref:SPOR domain-containing protein n=1 Tax=Polaribacter sp. SA4-12 TaxID=1312072 RepID=UPI000B3CF076|nr:SPOR domain-containing protein [Polaribacter sp. SA4-12]ARV13691.1 hypothetical protein BTO07_00405 [Polaribacter sp. SA4-12]
MKNFLFLIFMSFFFINTNSLSAQENENYLKVIAKSLPEQYLKSNSELFYTIQIGAFKNENKILDSVDNIVKTKENNLTKYRLGEFSTYEEAVEYKKMLLSVCNDAFIVPIKNGERIHIREALKLSAIL